MGFFDEVAGGLLKNVFSGQDAQGGMLESIMAILKSSESGGAEGLLNTFNEKGLGEVMSSWIGTGENLPISSEQIRQASWEVIKSSRLRKSWGFLRTTLRSVWPRCFPKLWTN